MKLKWLLPHNYTGYGYPNNAYCEKLIQLKPFQQLYATVTYLHSEKNVDIIRYFNGSEDYVGTRLEQKNVTVFFPHENGSMIKDIKLRFESDGSVQGNGPERLSTVILTNDKPAFVLEFTKNNSAITVELSNDLKNANDVIETVHLPKTSAYKALKCFTIYYYSNFTSVMGMLHFYRNDHAKNCIFKETAFEIRAKEEQKATMISRNDGFCYFVIINQVVDNNNLIFTKFWTNSRTNMVEIFSGIHFSTKLLQFSYNAFHPWKTMILNRPFYIAVIPPNTSLLLEFYPYVLPFNLTSAMASLFNTNYLGAATDSNNFAYELAPTGPLVKTDYGKIEGVSLQTTLGFKADVFLGIPYASPPIGSLRFEKPQPPKPWKNTFEASHYGFGCATYYVGINESLVSEDCLTLNIMRPSAPSKNANGYPVMFYIHGGGFITGASRDYPYLPIIEKLVKREIIVVTINYRLGPFGFYSTGNDFAPGNYGLWDQVEALKFVQKTISAFGGNPKSVTIFGESAGGASVSWLSLSPETEGLFARAIAMSGSSQAIWANTEDVVGFSKNLTKGLGCDKVEDLKKCIQRSSTHEVIKAAKSFIPATNRYDSPDFSYWNPRFDGDFIDAQNFKDAIKKAPKREHFIGIDSQEDIAFALVQSYNFTGAKYLPLPLEKALHFRRPNFTEAVSALLGSEEHFGKDKEKVAKNIVEFYEKNMNYKRNFFLQTFVQIFSDIHFNVPAMREAKMKAASGHKVYFYRYSHIQPNWRSRLVDGARHGSELENFFSSTTSSLEVQQTTADLFVNFAFKGIPSSSPIEAALVTTDKIPFVDINKISKAEDNLWPDRTQFWDQLAAEHGFDWPTGRDATNS
uniref:Carboxylesterase type B domain-containing protein n=1 Tax=Panagrolaimus sp. ES5 TaxID=591445 RepID=A0AC34FBK2_9BILA